MSELRELYQELIIDHGRKPRNFGVLPNANHVKEGYNPLCGDKLTVYIVMDGDKIADIHFEGCGCAISVASASLMTEVLKGSTLSEADTLFSQFHSLVTGNKQAIDTNFKKLIVLAGVSEFPARVKCATLAWHTAKAALYCSLDTVTTE